MKSSQKQVVGVGLAAVVVLIAAIAVWLAIGGGEDKGTPGAFYMEARVVPIGAPVGFGQPLSTIKAWYEPPNRSRWEFTSSSDSDRGLTLLFNEEGSWFYDPQENTYTHTGVSSNQTTGEPFQPFGLTPQLIGPLPSDLYNGIVSDLDEVGDDKILGRTVKVYESTEAGTLFRVWIDTERRFAMRQEVNDNSGSFRTEVTRLSYDIKHAAAIFEFRPPPGAREVEPEEDDEPTTGSGVPTGDFGNTDTTPPRGYLSLTYVPNGYVASRRVATTQGTRITQFSLLYLTAPNTQTPALIAQQQYQQGGLASFTVTGTPTQVGTYSGFLQTSGGTLGLIWAVGDVVITLSSDSLPESELIRIGEAMR